METGEKLDGEIGKLDGKYNKICISFKKIKLSEEKKLFELKQSILIFV